MILDLLLSTRLFRLLPTAFVRRWILLSAESPSHVNFSKRLKRLLVDVSIIHVNDAGTGIQRVVRSVSDELECNPPPGYMICKIAATRDTPYRYIDGPNVGELVNRIGAGDVFLGLDLVANILPRHTSQLLSWKRNGVKLHFFVYDLLPLVHSDSFTAARVRHFKRWVKVIAIFSDSLLCISHAVYEDMSRWLNQSRFGPQASLPMHVIPLGSNLPKPVNPVGPSAVVLSAINGLAETPWILMVGTVEPRKSHAQVLDAFEQLWDQGGPEIALIIVGHPGWKTEELQKRIREHPQKGQLLHWFEQANDDDLAYCYRNSFGLIAASSAEGYGLPIVEAMQLGKPVLARDIPIFREIAGFGIEYFTDDSAAALAQRLRNWLTTASLLSWDATATRARTWAEATLLITQALCLPARPSVSNFVEAAA